MDSQRILPDFHRRSTDNSISMFQRKKLRLLSSLYEASITVIPKTSKQQQQNEDYRPISD